MDGGEALVDRRQLLAADRRCVLGLGDPLDRRAGHLRRAGGEADALAEPLGARALGDGPERAERLDELVENAQRAFDLFDVEVDAHTADGLEVRAHRPDLAVDLGGEVDEVADELALGPLAQHAGDGRPEGPERHPERLGRGERALVRARDRVDPGAGVGRRRADVGELVDDGGEVGAELPELRVDLPDRRGVECDDLP